MKGFEDTKLKRRPFVFFDCWSRKRTQKAAQPKRKEAEGAVSPLPSMRRHIREYEWFVAPIGTSPESTLGMAVLQRAILDIITPGTPKRFRKSAIDWLYGRSGPEFEAEYALSFSRVVEGITSMEPSEFRRKIMVFAKEAARSEERADAFRFQRG